MGRLKILKAKSVIFLRKISDHSEIITQKNMADFILANIHQLRMADSSKKTARGARCN